MILKNWLLLQLWELTGMLTWTSASVSPSSASSASLSETRRAFSAVTLWASTPCPSAAWRKVSHRGSKSDKQWNLVFRCGAKLHQVTLCDHYCISLHSPCQHYQRLDSVLGFPLKCSLMPSVYLQLYIQFSFPFLPAGYRWVPLRSRDGCSLGPASLSVFVWYS